MYLGLNHQIELKFDMFELISEHGEMSSRISYVLQMKLEIFEKEK